MLTGENGILNRAQEAKEKSEQAQKQEKYTLSNTEEMINENINGTKIEQVNDENPGQLEQNSNGEYIVNSIEDFINFSWLITSGEDNFSGKTVKLGISLDFSSVKSYADPYREDYGKYGYTGELKNMIAEDGFNAIGISSFASFDEENNKKNFAGIFDGDNHEIINLTIKKKIDIENNYIGIGLFSVNNGTIKNLHLKNVTIAGDIGSKCNKYFSIGAIAGMNLGNISNVWVDGNINISDLRNNRR